MNNRRMVYTTPIPLPKMAMVRDQAPQRDPDMKKKLDRVIALLEELAKEKRPAATDVMAAKKAQRRENARRLRERDAKMGTHNDDAMTSLLDAIRQATYEANCDFAQAAYAARNPHKDQQDAPKDTRVQYPHKPRQRAPWEDRLATTDSASRFLIICEQSQAAYEARNPHKK